VSRSSLKGSFTNPALFTKISSMICISVLGYFHVKRIRIMHSSFL